MRLIIRLAFAALLCFVVAPNIVQAHGSAGHSHEPIDDAKAKDIAKRVVANMVQRKVLEQSWLKVEAERAELKPRKSTQEWVIAFSNAQENDAAKRTLYVFLSASGTYIAANHSGR